ncbi:MAG TPA: 6-phosphogluconolactonase [Bryobacteraceae bacterium]|jgi:6-phosphogluconolactonase
MSVSYQTCQNAPAAAEACASHVVAVLEGALESQELATLAVSGGTSPKWMFERLAASNLPWNRTHLFFVDERVVPPSDPASNFKLANEHLILPARVPQSSVHRVAGELAPQAAAQHYVEQIRRFFGLNEGDLPRFDVVHRGMGPDAHTASLFPGDPLIEDRQGIAAATFAAQFRQWRVTLLPGVLVAAKHTVFLVTGDDKKEALRSVIHGEYDPMRYPAQIATRPGHDVVWFLDQAAAALIELLQS